MAKKLDRSALLSEMADFQPPPRRYWLDKLTGENKAKALETRSMYQAGECPLSAERLHVYFRSKLGAKVAAATLRAWLQETT